MIDLNAKAIMARGDSYVDRVADPCASADRSDCQRWTPVHPDIRNADALYEYLSPEVRRFAIAMEATLRDAGDASGAVRVAPREGDQSRPERLLRHALAAAERLRAAIKHPGVTDRGGRPLAMEHPDRNPRRIANVLREAASVACYLLLIADVCGAMEDAQT